MSKLPAASTVHTLLIAAGFFLIPTHASGEDLRDLVTNGHRQSVEGIRTIKAKIAIQTEQVPILSGGGGIVYQSHLCEWWQDGSRVRCKTASVEAGIESDYCFADGESKTLSRQTVSGKGWTRSAVIRNVPEQEMGFANCWSWCLVTVRDRPRVSVLGILQDQRSTIAESGPGPQREFVVSWTDEDCLRKVWIDPRHGFWASKVHIFDTGDPRSLQIEKAVTEFYENVDGVPFPKTVVSKVYRDYQGKRITWMKHTARFSEVEVNHHIDKDMFSLAIPAGVPVADHRSRANYMMGEGGKPASPPLPAPHLSEGDAPPPRPAGWGRTVSILGCLAVGIGFLVYWVRFRRRRGPVT